MTLTNKVIIFLGNTRFDSHIQATSLFIARNLAKNNKVFFIDYPFTLKDYFNHGNDKELTERKKKFSLFSDGLLDTDQPNLKVVITPPVLPINFLPEGFIYRSLLKINEAVISRRIKKILRSEGVKDFIYINSFNFHYPNIASLIGPSLSIYHCVDPMIIPYDMKHGIDSENQLVKESDLVICTSKALCLEKKELNTNTYFVPNGTDASHGISTQESSIHEKLKHFPKPVIGYLGTIERRINYALIQETALANPDKTFIFAGPVSDNYVPESLYQTPNVHIIGPVPYIEVPQMIRSFDVAIIPFKKDEVSNTIFPIKLFEYLSAGKPVVMTDFNPDLHDFTLDCVAYCSDATSFTAAINDMLQNNTSLKISQRQELAAMNTWEKRTEKIAEIISSHLKQPQI